MPGYLENLTLRLAQGVSQLPEELRQRHAAYLLAAQRDDGGFAGREGASDLYYTSFALRSMALLGVLDGEPAARAAAFLKSRLAGQTPIIDFVSLLYGAALLDSAAGIDVFREAPAGWQDNLAALFEQFRRPDGGYAKTEVGQSSSTYHTFLIVLALQLIDRMPPEPERLVAFVRSRQREDGGFVEIGPMRKSGTNPTAAAAGLLNILNAFDDETRDSVCGFLLDVQNDEGGFTANTRIPLADVLSTFTAALTLADLGALAEIDLPAASRYVQSMEQPDGGFRGGAWDEGVDVEYAFYGLGALALLETAPAPPDDR
ncbi:MAG TPA: prenyltransferase/squalene oxidase repeat-containing protein [Pirellulales bacterium]|nr:prenyltransferase/squalene oxidase repeat-containing protein [Pirellulales bacterium]